MSNSDILLISDPGYEGSSLLFNLASRLSPNIVWIASEPPAIINAIIRSYNFKGKLCIATPKQWKGYNFVNLMNLNEVSIAISKAGENMDRFILLISVIPELLLIHGLEKTYLFILNTIWKIHNQGGRTLALITKGAQSRKDEIMMSRPFSMVFRLKKDLIDDTWKRWLIVESPCVSKEVTPIDVEDYKVSIPESVMEAIASIKKFK
ncbi:MAG: hypothetical protein DSY33_02515 [Archaeoglobus sp.]|nr:MAG: hypothetical protein DSY33_02515 [Archaeoglobus sp.]